MRTFLRSLSGTAALAAACCCGSVAQALPLSTLASPTGALTLTDFRTFSFNAGSGAGNVSLQLQGYNSLDGDNFYIDLFHVLVNGTEVFLATYDLGGGGLDHVFTAPLGGTSVKNASARTVDVNLPVSFIAGLNTVKISYTSPTFFAGSRRAGNQSLADEGWGLNRLSVSGAAAAPEPATLALVATALLGGAWVRRRHLARFPGDEPLR